MKTIESVPAVENISRIRVLVRGAVQGVGFRPFVYRLNQSLGLRGWVSNSTEGVILESEGPKGDVEAMLFRLQNEAPPNADIQSVDWVPLDVVGFTSFEIRESDDAGPKSARVLPDLSVCQECLDDIFDPSGPRHLYPFTNCTNCGPRFSIIEGLPYDRPFTTMKSFTMCADCQREYEDPSNRRFHAQPNACPACGPQIMLWDDTGKVIAWRNDALQGAVQAIRSGLIVAVKGVGGFHLLADATNDKAVEKLRKRKHRSEKPFAVMFPNLRSVKRECEVSGLEERLLVSPMAPIVILQRKSVFPPKGGHQVFNFLFKRMSNNLGSSCQGDEHLFVSQAVAPGNPTLGAMLPYSPLHAILMEELRIPVVATSGNISEEPICFGEKEVLERLGRVADLFLVHDRPIARAMDDSVVRVILDYPFVIRAGRGYAPVSISIDEKVPQALGLGGHLKNTLAVSAGESIFVSQHLGDLESKASYDAFQGARRSMMNLYDVDPEVVGHDLHPDYFSTVVAKEMACRQVPVQHHHAHIVSCMVEHGLKTRVLGVAWDGTGLGGDGTVWGGEFLVSDLSRFNRVGFFRNFRLPGGVSAVREPRRSALGLLYEIFGEALFGKKNLLPLQSFPDQDLNILKAMLTSGTNSPFTSSAGRLFDAVAALAGLKQISNFEGQAAMALEFALPKKRTGAAFSFPLEAGKKGCFIFNWEPMVRELIGDLKDRMPVGVISLKFHNALVEAILAIAMKIKIKDVVLSGGCFQNKYLLETAVTRLKDAGFKPYWPRRVPVNDGGLSLGQVAVAMAHLKEKI